MSQKPNTGRGIISRRNINGEVERSDSRATNDGSTEPTRARCSGKRTVRLIVTMNISAIRVAAFREGSEERVFPADSFADKYRAELLFDDMHVAISTVISQVLLTSEEHLIITRYSLQAEIYLAPVICPERPQCGHPRAIIRNAYLSFSRASARDFSGSVARGEQWRPRGAGSISSNSRNA